MPAGLNKFQDRLFCIVIPAYNYGHYMARAIDSVLAQSGDDYQIIIVDDGSTDHTAGVVKAYQNSSRSLTYFFQQNRGLAAARNLGVQLSNAEYLLFLDADDALLPGALSAFRSVVDHQRGIDFVIGGWVQVSSKGYGREIQASSLSSRRNENFMTLLRSSPVAVVNGSNVVNRRVFERLRFPETVRLWEDRVFYAQLFALYSGVSIIDPVVTVYRHADSLSHNVDLVRQDGPKTIDLLFNPMVLPPEFMSFRAEYMAITQRILFDALYVSGMYQEARVAFREMMRLSPRHALTLRSIRRFLKMTVALIHKSPGNSAT